MYEVIIVPRLIAAVRSIMENKFRTKLLSISIETSVLNTKKKKSVIYDIKQ